MQYAPIVSQKCTGSGVATTLGRFHCHQRAISCHIFMRVIIGDPELRVVQSVAVPGCPASPELRPPGRHPSGHLRGW